MRVLGEDDIRQICVEHRPLLRISGTEFQARQEPFQERWGCLRDRGIDIGHSDYFMIEQPSTVTPMPGL
jgi:hypothetical protein